MQFQCIFNLIKKNILIWNKSKTCNFSALEKLHDLHVTNISQNGFITQYISIRYIFFIKSQYSQKFAWSLFLGFRTFDR